MGKNAACELESVNAGSCPLCRSEPIREFSVVDCKTYWRCDVCHLTFLSSESYLSSEDELARYLLHENSPEDQHYREFLSRLTDHLIPKLKRGAHGLDFGSGPGPTLSVMLQESRISHGSSTILSSRRILHPLSGRMILSPAPRQLSISINLQRNFACLSGCSGPAGG